MRRPGVPAFVWVLGGLLALGWLLLTLGSVEVDTFPSAESTGPSGLSGFAELLRRQGYRVRIEHSATPRLAHDEVAILALLPDVDLGDWAWKHLEAGGRVLLLPLSERFDDASRDALQASIWTNDEGDSLTTSRMQEQDHLAWAASPLTDTDGWIVWYDEEEETAAALYRFDEGVSGEISDGIVATNRFLDQRDNAALLINFVHWIAPAGSKVVFVEESFGNGRTQGLLALVGPWAEAAGWQTLLLFVVIVFTLGKRFGLPDSSRTRQSGARELVDAIGQIYDRAGAASLALDAAATDADRRIRGALKMPRDAPPEARDRAIPPTLADALGAVERGSKLLAPPRLALQLTKTLDRELEAFLGAAHPPRRNPFRR